jgi:hypothetical protein
VIVASLVAGLKSPSPPMLGLQERSRLWIVSSWELSVLTPWIISLRKWEDAAKCVKQIESRHARRLSTWPRHSSPGFPGMAACEVREDSGVQHVSSHASDREMVFAMRTIPWHYSAQDLLRASCGHHFSVVVPESWMPYDLL